MSKWLYETNSRSNNFITNNFAFNGVVAIDSDWLSRIEGIFTDPSIFDSIASFFNDPTQTISHILIYPFEVPVSDATYNLILGRGEISYTENGATHKIPCKGVASSLQQYHDSLRLLFNKYVNGVYNDFRDYNGFTNISLYLPFLGEVEIPTNEVIGKWVRVSLAVNYSTGIGLYFITVGDSETVDYENDRIISKHKVQIAIEMPISRTNAMEVNRNLILAGARIAASVAIGAYTGTLAGAATTTAVTTTQTAREISPSTTNVRMRNPSTNRLINAQQTQRSGVNINTSEDSTTTTTRSGDTYTRNTLREISELSTGLLSNYFVRAETDKTLFTDLEQWATRTVKMIIRRPKFVDMGYYRRFLGSPLYEVRSLFGLSGYTEIGVVHLEGFNVTNTELEMIENELSNGVIF